MMYFIIFSFLDIFVWFIVAMYLEFNGNQHKIGKPILHIYNNLCIRMQDGVAYGIPMTILEDMVLKKSKQFPAFIFLFSCWYRKNKTGGGGKPANYSVWTWVEIEVTKNNLF